MEALLMREGPIGSQYLVTLNNDAKIEGVHLFFFTLVTLCYLDD